MAELSIEPRTTALVLIDLQKGIAGRPVAPHSSQAVISNAAALADRFRAIGSLVVLVRVSFSSDGRDRVSRPVDVAFPAGTPPAGWDEIVPELGPKENDILVTKRNWGAFSRRISICGFAGEGSKRSFWAASPPAWAWNPRRATPTSTTTGSSSLKTRCPTWMPTRMR